MDGLHEATGLQLAQDLQGGETAWAAGAIGPRRHAVSAPAGRDLRASLRADTLGQRAIKGKMVSRKGD